MSDDTTDSDDRQQSLLRQHWKAVALILGVGTVISIAGLLAALQWYDPGILSVLFSWPMLILYTVGLIGGVAVIAIYYVGGSTDTVTAFITTPDVDNQLSSYDAQKLAEWIVYHEHELIPESGGQSGVVPVTTSTSEDGVTTRIFQWMFTAKNTADRYVFLLDIEQEIDFAAEYVEHRTPDNIEQADAAMHAVQNKRLLKNPSEDEVKEAREALGNSVRNHEIIEEIDEDGNTTKRIRRDRTVRKQVAETNENT